MALLDAPHVCRGNRAKRLPKAFQRLYLWVARTCGASADGISFRWTKLAGDASDREFYRVSSGNWSVVVVVNPVGTAKGTGENDAYWFIGRHLSESGVPVPALYRYQRRNGWIIMEDLGDVSLQDTVYKTADPREVPEVYAPVLDALLVLHSRAKDGFRERWCYQGHRYDRQLMLEKESGYFLRAFLQGHLGWTGEEEPLLCEFQALANCASQAPTGFIIHRDLQSRNILFPAPGKPRMIDFQGARWGPLQYDVASLVLDPYVDLTQEIRMEILASYLERLRSSKVMDPDAFMAHYPIIALHRCLQILGAFSFLGHSKQKRYFLQWIPRAFEQLRSHLQAYPKLPCPILRGLVELLRPRVSSAF